MSSPVLVDIFGDVVSRVSTAKLAQLKTVKPEILAVNYLYGMPLEITSVLTRYTDTPEKYPLIALLQPFDEVSGDITGMAETGNLRFIFAAIAEKQWLTPERYEKNFKPILYPIVDEFFNQMYLDPKFLIGDVLNISYTKRDWPFWDDGKDKNPFNDVLDVIEINLKSLKININYC